MKRVANIAMLTCRRRWRRSCPRPPRPLRTARPTALEEPFLRRDIGAPIAIMSTPAGRDRDFNGYFRSGMGRRHSDCPWYARAGDVPLDAECARLQRTRNSHRGIGERSRLREIEAHAVNQDYLDELASLAGLECLALEYPVTAADLEPIKALRELRMLTIHSPRNVRDFTAIAALPRLEVLFIENARQMIDLSWLRPLHDRLKVLGIEGGMYSVQRIPTLAPLEGFALHALFLTSTSLADQSLAALHNMETLRYLGTARNAPFDEFAALRAARPQLQCDWFDPAMWDAPRWSA